MSCCLSVTKYPEWFKILILLTQITGEKFDIRFRYDRIRRRLISFNLT